MMGIKRAKLKDDDGDSVELFHAAMRERVAIDKHALDDMWLEQPAIYQEIGDRLALEISKRDEAKDDLRDVEGELDADVREAHAGDDKKPTETAIKNEVRADDKYKRSQSRLRACELIVARLGALKDTFHQRRYALQDLTSLHLGGYYTSNSGGAKDARANTHERSRERMNAERKRAREEE